ncbi:MAG TPA: chloride channel protein [Steroidobacteraceae bacterium]|nr:chloride channel protein [Steroidobacteraceae bacterium]
MRLRLQKTLALHEWRRRLVFWGGALATGAIAVVFARASTYAMLAFKDLRIAHPWFPYVATPLGLALASWLTLHVFVGAEGSGIPQTIAALSLPTEGARNRLLSLKIAGGKMLLCLLALAAGASIGREGPTVQVGASIMHFLRRTARFSATEIDRGLILAGGAAGIAAAFNTPLAGVVFAIEELSRSFEERTSGTILTAVIVAGVTSLALIGNYTYFGVTNAVMSEPKMWLSVPVCGIVGGLFGGIFSYLTLRLSAALPGPLERFRRARPVAFAAGCGCLLVLLGWLSSSTTYGTGYDEAKALVQYDALPHAGFAIYKLLATLISYVSGIPGGIFAPSLAVGAGIGARLHVWWPLAPAGAMVLMSMAAYFAGVVQAPLTALVIVTEMTGNRALTLPLMAVVLIGRAASALVCRRSLYHTLAKGFIARAQEPGTAAVPAPLEPTSVQ